MRVLGKKFPSPQPLTLFSDGSGEFSLGVSGRNCCWQGLGQEPDEEDDVDYEDAFVAHQIQIYKAGEAEHEALE